MPCLSRKTLNCLKSTAKFFIFLCLLLFFTLLIFVKTFPENSGDFKETFPSNLNGLRFDPTYHLYTENGKPILWTFWHSKTIPPGVYLSISSVACHNPRCRLKILHRDDIYDYVNDVHPAYEYLSPVHKSDYLRLRILEYGGIYLDIDSIGFAPFWPKIQLLKEYDMVGGTWPPEKTKITMGVLGPMRANNTFIKRAKVRVHEFLDKKLKDLRLHQANSTVKYPIDRVEIGFKVSLPTFDEALDHIRYWSEDARFTYGQLVATLWHGGWHLERKSPEKVLKFRETEILYYHNHATPKQLGEISIHDWLKSDYALAGMLRMAFKKCKEENMVGNYKYDLNNRKTFEFFNTTVLQNDDRLIGWIEDYVKKMRAIIN